jgi:hypothetical protein
MAGIFEKSDVWRRNIRIFWIVKGCHTRWMNAIGIEARRSDVTRGSVMLCAQTRATSLAACRCTMHETAAARTGEDPAWNG